MKKKIQKLTFSFRRLKLLDFGKFRKLFNHSFKKNISYEFFKWRYFSKDSSFCYGVFNDSKLIANVGIKSLILNNKRKEFIYSRHSSMVLNNFRGQKIFSNLLNEVKKKKLNNSNIILMWPNNKNFSNFGISESQIIKKFFYLYLSKKQKNFLDKTINHNIIILRNLKNKIRSNNSFLLKNFKYFKNRYLDYKKNDYYINEFKKDGISSFFIIKKKNRKRSYNVILDHFGSNNIKSKHLKYLTDHQGNMVFWSRYKLKKNNYELLNKINLHIGFISKIKINKNYNFFSNKEFMIGDTDSFIDLE